MNKRTSSELKRIIGIAVFSAMAFVVSLTVRVPVQFLTFDAKDAFICIASFIYGPLAAVAISFIAAFLEFITISSTGMWGLLMNFLSSAAFSFTASYVYSRHKTLNYAIIGLYTAVIVTTCTMLILNVFVTPLYLGAPREAVIELLPGLLLPFNLAKALVNGAIVMIIYKPISVALRRAKLIDSYKPKHIYSHVPPAEGHNDALVKEPVNLAATPAADSSALPSFVFNKGTVITLVLGAITVAAGVLIFVLIS